MNNMLKKISLLVGLALLAISMMWSQDGFNFDLAGDSGGTKTAAIVGWVLAVSVTTIQFVFSTNYNKLNPSLVTFGIIAYIYSIYTNQLGITHFQGESANSIGAWILAFVMDGIPEPLIAWSLGESLTGDFIGNILKAMEGKSGQQSHKPQPPYRPNAPQSRPHRKPGKQAPAYRSIGMQGDFMAQKNEQMQKLMKGLEDGG